MTLGPIFVRDAYVRLLGLVSDRLELGIPNVQRAALPESATQKRTESRQVYGGVVVTGTQGVGTTAFMWYVVRHVSQTRTVVVDVPNLFVLVRPDGTVLGGSREYSFRKELSHSDTVYVTNEEQTEGAMVGEEWGWVKAKIIIAAPPDRDLLEYYQRLEPTLMTVFVPLWSRDEAAECIRLCYPHGRRRINNMTEDEVATLHDPFLNCIRNLVSDAKRLTQEELSVLRLSEGMDFMTCELPPDDIYLTLLYLKPSSDFLSATLGFASAAVRQEVTKRYEELAARS